MLSSLRPVPGAPMASLQTKDTFSCNRKVTLMTPKGNRRNLKDIEKHFACRRINSEHFQKKRILPKPPGSQARADHGLTWAGQPGRPFPRGRGRRARGSPTSGRVTGASEASRVGLEASEDRAMRLGRFGSFFAKKKKTKPSRQIPPPSTPRKVRATAIFCWFCKVKNSDPASARAGAR